MTWSSEEEEVLPEAVSKYYFLDEKHLVVAFTILPFKWGEVEIPGATSRQVFLHGLEDGGVLKVVVEVTAWKLSLKFDRPQFSVLSKQNRWIKLLKRWKSYEDCIRTVLITGWWLHIVKRTPGIAEGKVWDLLHKLFSSYKVPPSSTDLEDHLSLIKVFSEKDETLSKSELVFMFLEDMSEKGASSYEPPQTGQFTKESVVGTNDMVDESVRCSEGDEFEEGSGLYDSVCAICDNGGEILWYISCCIPYCCEGKCMRSFHPTKDSGIDSNCASLGYSRAEVEALQNFVCKNCLYKQHQCFFCGKLGCSDKSVGAEVLPCVSATCSLFYHANCVAELLFPGNKAEAAEYQKRVKAGESFICPVHKCSVCRRGEIKMIRELQFAICRRCPKTYHRKCLPRGIAFEDSEDGRLQRAWDDLLPNRILIYCLKHKIDEHLGTPIRNHILFPDIPLKKDVMSVHKPKIKIKVKKRQILDKPHIERTTIDPRNITEKPSSLEVDSAKKGSIYSREDLPPIMKKAKALGNSSSSEPCQDYQISVSEDRKNSWKENTSTLVTTYLPNRLRKKFKSSFPVIDRETETRMLDLMNKVSSSITLEDIIKKQTAPKTHAYTARLMDKNITQGKVEGSVNAVRTALLKIESGGSIEDAKAVCEPEVLLEMYKWKQKLKVYLAPFLLGVRYTSFGRHFTKVEKLQEVVEKLHWYVQDGDTIVDFCCGANDFSRLLKEKLEKVGKKASFRNFDLMQPKDDFNFEKRDWMTVEPDELPHGSKLIMGLNPPFGVKAGLANKFINKALTFRPKLLILIVPKTTERLDRKFPAYDLIWEDEEKFAGKSFYLPGSVDIEDQQLDQWNLKAPPLYLWSHPDWTAKHREITLKHSLMPADFHSSPDDQHVASLGNPNAEHRANAQKAICYNRKKFKNTMLQNSNFNALDASILPPHATNDGSHFQCPHTDGAVGFTRSICSSHSLRKPFEEHLHIHEVSILPPHTGNDGNQYQDPQIAEEFGYGRRICGKNPFKRSSEEFLRMQVRLHGMRSKYPSPQNEYAPDDCHHGRGTGDSSSSNYGHANSTPAPPPMQMPVHFPGTDCYWSSTHAVP